MTPSSVDELDRLFERVVRAVRESRPENLSNPIEVGELLDLVPYRTVRSEIGVETSDDFAHTVTRLLSGERGFLFVDDLMGDDLKAELASPNPDLAAYRVYLNARVSLAREHTKRVIESMPLPEAATSPLPPGVPVSAPRADSAPADGARGLESAPAPPLRGAEGAASAPPAIRISTAPPAAAVSPRREAPTGPRASRPVSLPRPLEPDHVSAPHVGRPGCKYCGHALPQGREVRFCPACGQNLLVRRCAACSAEVESGWKFCIACGRAASP